MALFDSINQFSNTGKGLAQSDSIYRQEQLSVIQLSKGTLRAYNLPNIVL